MDYSPPHDRGSERQRKSAPIQTAAGASRDRSHQAYIHHQEKKFSAWLVGSAVGGSSPAHRVWSCTRRTRTRRGLRHFRLGSHPFCGSTRYRGMDEACSYNIELTAFSRLVIGFELRQAGRGDNSKRWEQRLVVPMRLEMLQHVLIHWDDPGKCWRIGTRHLEKSSPKRTSNRRVKAAATVSSSRPTSVVMMRWMSLGSDSEASGTLSGSWTETDRELRDGFDNIENGLHSKSFVMNGAGYFTVGSIDHSV
ncbi:hypothetical protein C8F04DRAFT_1151510 [Mycena alexandri]|uniref:Uncharacterized protein n=1 Tax=Mycena alexandri TaxID=1745969 RepID=A0AAD6RZM2_9AGAR|nr:hypothetical protein C8F04DRAFT_1151510 [Mycena alexandri]